MDLNLDLVCEPVTILHVMRELSAIQQCPKLTCPFFELAHFVVDRLALYVIVILHMVGTESIQILHA